MYVQIYLQSLSANWAKQYLLSCGISLLHHTSSSCGSQQVGTSAYELQTLLSQTTQLFFNSIQKVSQSVLSVLYLHKCMKWWNTLVRYSELVRLLTELYFSKNFLSKLSQNSIFKLLKHLSYSDKSTFFFFCWHCWRSHLVFSGEKSSEFLI